MNQTVERQGATVEEATSEALAALGLKEDQATVEVLSSGRRGLFGGNRPAHVRVTANDPDSATSAIGVASTDEGDGADASTDGDDDSAGDVVIDGPSGEETPMTTDVAAAGETDEVETSPEQRLDELDEEADLAADFVEGLLDLLDLPGDIEIEVAENQALVNVSDVGSGLLIGRRGATLDALQELVRSATQRQTERRAHVRVDVEGYRARHLDKLRSKCRDAIAQVRETGNPVRLEPMDAYERKMMHDLAANTGGVTSSSEGNEPKRRVVIHPATD